MFSFRLFLITCLLICSNIGDVQAACFRTCNIDESGYLLIKQFEGYSAFVYKDVNNVPTIGFGHALLPGERFKQPLLGPDAQKLLEKDIAIRLRPLNSMIKIPLEICQFNALASFSYNVGLGNLKSSTLLKRVNAKRHEEVPPQFLRWNKSGGIEYRGLTIRRNTEANFYRGILCPSVKFTLLSH